MHDTNWIQIVTLLASSGGLLAAFRAWAHSSQAKDLMHELLEDVGEHLRTDIITAAAEAAQQVIEKLPKKRLAKSADPEAGDPAVTQ